MAEGRRPWKTLGSNTDGAMLVIGVFMAVFLVAMLFYVVGIGEAVLRRERLGDAADAVSMTAAVLHARAMNLIVLLNQVMAALLAVLVALRLVEMLATLAIVILLAAAFFGGAGGLAAIPGLETVRSGARNAYSSLDEPVHSGLRALNGVARAVSDAGPALAELEALSVVARLDPRGRVTKGFVVPPRATLPVEDDGFDVLCERAGKDAASVAMIPLRPVLPGISGEIESALGELAGSASDWFCGKSGGKPPAVHRTVKRVLPVLGARARCEASTIGTATPASPTACDDVDAAEAASQPDGSGGCRSECGSSGPYEQRIQKAREQCNPGQRAGLRGFSWQERTARIEFAFAGGWHPTGRRWDDAPRFVARDDSNGEHPCGTALALYSSEFAASVHPAADDPSVIPVCSTPPLFPVRPPGASVTLEVTEVLQILRCVVDEDRTIGGNFSDSGRSGDTKGEAPKRVIADAVLGGEAFQQRGVVIGRGPSAYVEGLVKLSTWGREAEDTAATLAPLGRLSFAQAEYYFDHDGRTPREEWMWNRRWTARLRRFQVPATSSWLGAAAGLVPAGLMSAASGLSSH